MQPIHIYMYSVWIVGTRVRHKTVLLYFPSFSPLHSCYFSSTFELFDMFLSLVWLFFIPPGLFFGKRVNAKRQRHDRQSFIAVSQFLLCCAAVTEWGHLRAGRAPASLARSIVEGSASKRGADMLIQVLIVSRLLTHFSKTDCQIESLFGTCSTAEGGVQRGYLWASFNAQSWRLSADTIIPFLLTTSSNHTSRLSWYQARR